MPHSVWANLSRYIRFSSTVCLNLHAVLSKESMKITELIWVQSYLILDQVSDKMCKFNISVDNFQLDLQTFTARANKGRRGQNTCILGLLQHYESQQKIHIQLGRFELLILYTEISCFFFLAFAAVHLLVNILRIFDGSKGGMLRLVALASK